MSYILSFDLSYGLTQYLDWLNQSDCNFRFDQETPWINKPNFEILISLEESQEDKLSDFFFCGPLIIVSEKFKTILENYSLKLEFVPTTIMCGEEEFTYFSLHIMDQIDAVDIDSTEFIGMKYGMLAGITSLKLKDSISSNIYALKNTFNPIIIVNDRVKEQTIASGLSGMQFIPVDQYIEDIRGI